ncbi:MAG: hypothetical protein ACXWFB_12745 [Nitrososphaeraceae archaeon]
MSFLMDLVCLIFNKINMKEYLSIAEMSLYHSVSKRTILNRVKSLVKEVLSTLLFKKNGEWYIHHLLVPKFVPKYKLHPKQIAFSVDPCAYYSESDIENIMEFIFGNINQSTTEIQYVIERKISNNQNHLHCLITGGKMRDIVKSFKLGFGEISFKKNKIYDLSGWKRYMKKMGSKLITLKLVFSNSIS